MGHWQLPAGGLSCVTQSEIFIDVTSLISSVRSPFYRKIATHSIFHTGCIKKKKLDENKKLFYIKCSKVNIVAQNLILPAIPFLALTIHTCG